MPASPVRIPPAARRAIGAIGVVTFLVFWIWACVEISDRLPSVGWLRGLFLAVAGTAWGLPLFPLISWSEGGKPRT